MEKYGVNELRKMFLNFFEGKGHLVMKSFSLIPHNDKSLLLINAGMAPLKPYFTGQEIPPSKRVTTCQKCIRTGDIDNVGKTARHGTFFEMLGNFSFGDYFKHEAISWCWEFLTETVGLDKDRLYPSVYEEDDEAYNIWKDEIGIAPERIFRFGKEDNFWEHGAGPCGPCSEVYYDRGPEYGCGKPTCTVGCDCDRYIEIWNNVFTQFEGDGKGKYELLENKNIDTGMGLERLAAVVQDVPSIFDIDTIRSLRDHVCRIAGKEYKGGTGKDDVSIRVVTDHIRSVTFMISDGIRPSNVGRGYVLRRLLRRACRHGRLLGIHGAFLSQLAQTVIDGSKDAYPELEEEREHIFKVISEEEEQFNKTIDRGIDLLGSLLDKMNESGITELDGNEAFKLYDTYGFPLDLTKEILAEHGYTVDEPGFEKAMQEQKKRARAARTTTNYMGADATVYESVDPSVTTEFMGYDHTEYDSEITVMTTDREITDTLQEGSNGTIFVPKTPFYATSGGQEGDTGTITTEDGCEFRVSDTIKLPGGKFGHVGTVVEGTFHTGDEVHLKIDRDRRLLSGRNHSATHLLQKSLRLVLGDHVEQAGSLVTSDRLRFDFSHNEPMTEEQIAEVEHLVNKEIAAALPVRTDIMPIEEAKKTGAEAHFGEKYGSVVRVVSMGDFSKELCGGTHVPNTSTIQAFKILSESGVASGVRRIEAVTSAGLIEYYDHLEHILNESSRLLKAQPETITDRVSRLLEEVKDLQSENEKLKSRMASEAAGDVMDNVREIGGFKFIAAEVDNVSMNELRELGDQFRDKLGEGVVVLASAADGKVSMMAAATDGAVKAGAHAGNILKEIVGLVGGGGGGRPNMASAGGKNPEGIQAALDKAAEVLSAQLQK